MHRVRSPDGTTIALDRIGHGPPVVLVGGALNDREAPGAGGPLARLLAPHHTVFTYDRRGRGDSGDTAPYAVAREIEDLGAVIAAAGGSAFVYGMSSGAALALRGAAAGVAITRLALFEPPFTAGDAMRLRGAREYAVQLEALLAAGRHGDAVELFLRFAGLPAASTIGIRRHRRWAALERLAPTLAYDAAVLHLAETGGELPRDGLAAVVVPTLVVDGEASTPPLRRAARAVAAALPHARTHTLPDQTHDVDPKVLAPVLAAFFGE